MKSCTEITTSQLFNFVSYCFDVFLYSYKTATYATIRNISNAFQESPPGGRSKYYFAKAAGHIYYFSKFNESVCKRTSPNPIRND